MPLVGRAEGIDHREFAKRPRTCIETQTEMDQIVRACRSRNRADLWALPALLMCFLVPSAEASSVIDPSVNPPQGQAACTCPDPFDHDSPIGVVWQGPPPAPDLPALARLLAPILWYSSDEPLILKRPGTPIPHAHPCDSPSSKPVVYYQ